MRILDIEESEKQEERESDQQTGNASNQLSTEEDCEERSFNADIAVSSSSTLTPTLGVNTKPKKRRKSNPAKWKRNVNKACRLKGEEYVTVKGKTIPGKPMRPPPCVNRPNHKCCERIPEAARKIIFDQFHSYETLQAQREFLVRHITQETPKRKVVSGDSRKAYVKRYTLTDGSISHTICREFFLATLGISEGLIKGAFKKLSSSGVVQPDQRGEKKKSN